MKRQPTEWEKVLANYLSDELYPEYKELIQLGNKMTVLFIKWAKDVDSIFQKRKIQQAH